jgi:hypothetical protein
VVLQISDVAPLDSLKRSIQDSTRGIASGAQIFPTRRQSVSVIDLYVSTATALFI